VQIYAEGSHGTRAKPQGGRLCPAMIGGKNWAPSASNPELGLIYVPSIEGCNAVETVEQKDFVAQGGIVNPRDRFTAGAFSFSERLYGSLKALDPVTGETKAQTRLEYPNFSGGGALATAGNLVFLGQADGTFGAYDARTLKELWSFNVGTGISAPAISFAVNGKQYIAILAGFNKQTFGLLGFPALNNTAPASMLFVFGATWPTGHYDSFFRASRCRRRTSYE
jgi:alcohol dehydrogenase (cytochrome c)